MLNYHKKYLKYKAKYLQLKGGATQENFNIRFRNSTGESQSSHCPDSYYNFSFNETDIINYCKFIRLGDDLNSQCMPVILTHLAQFNNNQNSSIAGFIENKVRDYLKEKNLISEEILSAMPLATNRNKLAARITRLLSLIPRDLPQETQNQITKEQNYFLITTNQLSREDGTMFVNKICQKIDQQFNIYFVDNILTTIKSFFPTINNISCRTTNVTRNTCNSILLRPTSYINIAGNTDLIVNQDTICLEGNRIFADHQSKIASGTITTCCFMVLLFSNGNVITSHLGGAVANKSLFEPKLNVQWKIANETCLQKIREHFPDEIPLLEKVFFGGYYGNYLLVENHADLSFVYLPEYMSYLKDSYFPDMNLIKPNDDIIFKTAFLSKLGLPYIDNINFKFHYDFDQEEYKYIVSNGNVYNIVV